MPDANWINTSLYPFTSHYHKVEAGRLHFIDSGDGEPVVFVHGNPTWSFLYRKLILELNSNYRCIAPDHIGFGLSDKPAKWNYKVRDHAKNFESLMNSLSLDSFSLAVHDWGGPIGLSYALNNSDRVNSLIVMNTWMWPLNNDLSAQTFSRILGGRIGQYLIKHWHIFVNIIMKLGTHHRLSPGVHDHYKRQFSNDSERKGIWMFPYEIIQASDWLNELWEKRSNIADVPTLLLWGSRDPAFRKSVRKQWENFLKNFDTYTFDDASHYIQEDVGSQITQKIRAFLASD